MHLSELELKYDDKFSVAFQQINSLQENLTSSNEMVRTLSEQVNQQEKTIGQLLNPSYEVKIVSK
jgi:hypothetical protein